MNQQVATLPTRLNLGCGSFKKPGFLNVDMVPEVEPDLILDLDSLPYPFPDNHFELIEAFHVLEHLQDPFQAIAEMYRIAKPGGQNSHPSAALLSRFYPSRSQTWIWCQLSHLLC